MGAACAAPGVPGGDAATRGPPTGTAYSVLASAADRSLYRHLLVGVELRRIFKGIPGLLRVDRALVWDAINTIDAQAQRIGSRFFALFNDRSCERERIGVCRARVGRYFLIIQKQRYFLSHKHLLHAF